MSNEHDIDIQILYSLKQGDKNAFEIVFRKYVAKIYHFAKNTLYNENVAEDITQNVFLSLWEHRMDIIPEKNFSAYLYTIAKNLIYRETEKMLLAFRYTEHLNKTHQTDEDLFTEEMINANSLEELIFRLVEQLPEARKKIFLLHFVDDLSNKDIATQLSISEDNVAQQIRRSITYLKKHLKDYVSLSALLYL